MYSYLYLFTELLTLYIIQLSCYYQSWLRHGTLIRKLIQMTAFKIISTSTILICSSKHCGFVLLCSDNLKQCVYCHLHEEQLITYKMNTLQSISQMNNWKYGLLLLVNMYKHTELKYTELAFKKFNIILLQSSGQNRGTSGRHYVKWK